MAPCFLHSMVMPKEPRHISHASSSYRNRKMRPQQIGLKQEDIATNYLQRSRPDQGPISCQPSKFNCRSFVSLWATCAHVHTHTQLLSYRARNIAALREAASLNAWYDIIFSISHAVGLVSRLLPLCRKKGTAELWTSMKYMITKVLAEKL